MGCHFADARYAGSIQKLWAQLDDDNSGVITLAELDPAAHKCIEAFWALINDRSRRAKKTFQYLEYVTE